MSMPTSTSKWWIQFRTASDHLIFATMITGRIPLEVIKEALELACQSDENIHHRLEETCCNIIAEII
jgi:hypothetical protein